jgi:hypothetical protein
MMRNEKRDQFYLFTQQDITQVQASILLLQITGNQMFGVGYPLVAQHSDYGSHSQFVEELKYRDRHTYTQVGDLSFWNERRVKSVHLCNQLTGNSAFASSHFISRSYCTNSRLISVSTLQLKTHSRKQTHVTVTGSSDSVTVIIRFLVN